MLELVKEDEKKYRFKIDLAPGWLPYRFSLYKNIKGKWYPMQNNDSISALEEEIKQQSIFPLFYE